MAKKTTTLHAPWISPPMMAPMMAPTALLELRPLLRAPYASMPTVAEMAA
jgi:hypothetical protein